MKRVTWDTRQTGDLYLTAAGGLLGDGIQTAELAMHPAAPRDFVPSHAGIVGFDALDTIAVPTRVQRTVVEAWLDLHENSVACINPAEKWDAAAKLGLVEVWRPDAFDPEALRRYIARYGPEKYGALNLAGFEWVAAVKALTGKDVANPVEISQVCSQGDGDFLTINYGFTGAEAWIMDVKICNLDPEALRLNFVMEQR